MNVSCGSCPAKYAVPDEKVRGRKVRIMCKRCGAAIIVDGTSREPGAVAKAPSSVGGDAGIAPSSLATQASVGSAAKRAMKQTMIGIAPPSPGAAPAPAAPLAPSSAAAARPGATASESRTSTLTTQAANLAGAREALGKRTMLGGLQGAGSATETAIATPVAIERARKAREPAQTSAPEWTVAITDEHHEEMSTAEVIELFSAGTITEDTFIWKEGMDDWQTPLEIPAIAEKLRRRGIGPGFAEQRASVPRPLNDEDEQEQATIISRVPVEKQGPGTPMGVWREPGNAGRVDGPSWNDPELPGPDDVSFDDVTVAMAAPQAEELLRAAASDPPDTASPAPRERQAFSAEAAPMSEPPPPPNVARAEPTQRDKARVVSKTPTTLRAALSSRRETEPPSSPLRGLALEPRAARRDSAPPKARDLFGDVHKAGGDDDFTGADDASQPRLAGARNESSVLFSLDAMVKSETEEEAKPAKEEDDVLGLARQAAASSSERDEEALANMGGGSFVSQSLAAPDFSAPVRESMAPRASAPAPAAEPRVSQSLIEESAPKSQGWLWAVLLLVLALMGAGGALLLKRPNAIFGALEPASTLAPSDPISEPVATAAPSPNTPSNEASASTTATTAMQPSSAAPETAAQKAPPARDEKKPRPDKPESAENTQKESEAAGLPEFDTQAASVALGTAAGSVGSCKQPDGRTGAGRAAVTFSPSGRATHTVVTGDFAGTAVGGCVARIFRMTRVPPFAGEPVTVAKSFVIN